MRTSAFLIVLLGLFALAFAPGNASAAEQGAGVLASSAAERAAAVSGPVINVTPASHDFGRTNVGTTTGAFDFTVQNNGDATLMISSITHSGTGFSATLGSSSIPAHTTTTLSSAYTPLGSGPQSDNITLVTNADNGNFSVLATGRANNAPVFNPALNANYNAPAFVNFTLTASASDQEGDGLPREHAGGVHASRDRGQPAAGRESGRSVRRLDSCPARLERRGFERSGRGSDSDLRLELR